MRWSTYTRSMAAGSSGLKGFSQQNAEGKPLYSEDANMGFLQAMRETLAPQVKCIEKDMHINDPVFADEIVRAFLSLSGYSGS